MLYRPTKYLPSLPALLAGSAVVFVSLLAVSCGGGDDAASAGASPDVVISFPSATGNVTPIPRRTPTPTVSPSPSPLKVCAPNPDPAQPKLLQVQDPQPGQQVKVPFYVRGWGSNIGFENKGVALAIVNVKQEVKQVLDLPPQPRNYRIAPPGMEITENTKPFGADIVINNITEPTPYCLWVYQETTAEGTPKGVVQVPIMVLP
ncbi:MAG: hypothetical protein E6J42_12805 [Chloroflexi bacterium]|nr:MAG: hypothetical protein E6J42_12805 [Chloroflexota bacterium]